MSKSITDIYARRGKRGEVERFDFSGAEAKKEIDQYIDTIKATKEDLDADKAASAEYADRAEKASSSAEQSASSAAGNAADAISAAKSAKKSADDAAKVKTSVDISAGDATTAAAAAKAWAVGPSGASEGGTETNNAKYWAEIAKDNASHAGVNSWNGRSGAVAPQEGDYTAEMVGALPSEGTAVAAEKLSSVRKITANLENEGGSSFDGTKDVSVGVIGALPVTHGGTGGTTAADARKKLGVPSTDTASPSANGLMSSTDKNKLNGVEEGANNTVVDNELSSFSTNPVQNKVVNEAIVEINEKLNGIEDGANKTIVDEALSATSTNPVQNKTVNSIITDLTGQVTGVKDSCSSMWTASQAYVAGQYAIYNNYIYRCIKNASAGTIPTNTTYWAKTDLASEITSLNSKLMYTYPILWDYANVSFGSGQINASSEGCAIFLVPANTERVVFQIHGEKTSTDRPFYLQYGICGKDAKAPTVLTQGLGRGEFLETKNSESREISFTFGRKAGMFYVGGNNYLIENVMCIKARS